MLPKIEKNRCVSCGACISSCPTGVFDSGRDNPIIVNPSVCISCKVCAISCPRGAILFSRKAKRNRKE